MFDVISLQRSKSNRRGQKSSLLTKVLSINTTHGQIDCHRVSSLELLSLLGSEPGPHVFTPASSFKKILNKTEHCLFLARAFELVIVVNFDLFELVFTSCKGGLDEPEI